MRTYFFSFIFITAACLCSCSKNQSEEPQPLPPNGNEVTRENVSYVNFTAALFQSKCSQCHAPGGQGSSAWTFNGYSSVKDHAEEINQAVLVTGQMPLTGSLSTSEKALLKAWFDRNLPEN